MPGWQWWPPLCQLRGDSRKTGSNSGRNCFWRNWMWKKYSGVVHQGNWLFQFLGLFIIQNGLSLIMISYNNVILQWISPTFFFLFASFYTKLLFTDIFGLYFLVRRIFKEKKLLKYWQNWTLDDLHIFISRFHLSVLGLIAS